MVLPLFSAAWVNPLGPSTLYSPSGPELIRAAFMCRQISAIAATLSVPPCVAVCPQARGMSRKAPGRPGRPHPSYRGESEAPCAKDLGYGNNTVPQEFSG